jgi:phosphoglycolate phosphatase
MQTMNYTSIIWDWNGTLLNDVELCVEIVSELVEPHRDEPLTLEEYKAIFGFPIIDYYQKIGIDLARESFEQLTYKFISQYNDRVRACALHQGVTATLDLFRRRNLSQFILTAAHKEDVEKLLAHFEIEDYFQGIEGLDNHRAESKVERGKALIRNHGIQQERTLLVGDTIHDFEVAEAMGVDCILISNGHQSKDRLIAETEGPGKVQDRIEALHNLIF